MKPDETELGELRRRIERLELEVASLRAPGAVTVPSPDAPEPPLLAVAAPPVAPGPAATPPPVPSAAAAGRTGMASSTAWVAAAGAVIFLLGAVYGLTVSIQRGWISPPVRVAAGLGLGVAAGVAAARLLAGGRNALGVALLAVGAGTWTFALYFGSHGAGLFPVGFGFAGMAVATFLAGALGSRARCDGALAVAVATGLVTPFAFSPRDGSLPGLLTWLLALLGAQLAAHYATGSGSGWTLSRGLGIGGVWLAALLGAVGSGLGDPAVALGLLAALGAAGLLLAWLPRHPEDTAERAAAPSAVVLVALAVAAWVVWRRTGWDRETFAVVLVGLAAVSLGLQAVARRAGLVENAGAFLLLAAGFGFVAVPVAFDWRWVVLAWGAGAALLAAAAGREGADRSLRVVAHVATLAAAAVWLSLVVGQGKSDLLFLNRVFAGAVLVSAAWWLLLRAPVGARGLPLAGLQAVAVNAVAWELARRVPVLTGPETRLPLGALLATLTYAGAGAGQWLRGVAYEADPARARALRIAGYAWLIVAALKLLAFDLSNRDLLFRAAAALGVGAMFIAAAWWADRRADFRRSSPG
jgi:hypothetical protein